MSETRRRMSFKCNLNVFRAGGMGGGRRNFRRTDPNSSFRIELRNQHEAFAVEVRTCYWEIYLPRACAFRRNVTANNNRSLRYYGWDRMFGRLVEGWDIIFLMIFLWQSEENFVFNEIFANPIISRIFIDILKIWDLFKKMLNLQIIRILLKGKVSFCLY